MECSYPTSARREWGASTRSLESTISHKDCGKTQGFRRESLDQGSSCGSLRSKYARLTTWLSQVKDKLFPEILRRHQIETQKSRGHLFFHLFCPIRKGKPEGLVCSLYSTCKKPVWTGRGVCVSKESVMQPPCEYQPPSYFKTLRLVQLPSKKE